MRSHSFICWLLLCCSSAAVLDSTDESSSTSPSNSLENLFEPSDSDDVIEIDAKSSIALQTHSRTYKVAVQEDSFDCGPSGSAIRDILSFATFYIFCIIYGSTCIAGKVFEFVEIGVILSHLAYDANTLHAIYSRHTRAALLSSICAVFFQFLLWACTLSLMMAYHSFPSPPYRLLVFNVMSHFLVPLILHISSRSALFEDYRDRKRQYFKALQNAEVERAVIVLDEGDLTDEMERALEEKLDDQVAVLFGDAHALTPLTLLRSIESILSKSEADSDGTLQKLLLFYFDYNYVTCAIARLKTVRRILAGMEHYKNLSNLGKIHRLVPEIRCQIMAMYLKLHHMERDRVNPPR